jgi:putative addiction module component (TIGR02574 family)
MSMTDKILVDVLALNSHEKIQLVEKILSSLHPTNKGVAAVWEEEAEERLVAFSEGRVPTVDVQDVLQKYGN